MIKILVDISRADISQWWEETLCVSRLAAVSHVLFWYAHSESRKTSQSVYVTSTLLKQT